MKSAYDLAMERLEKSAPTVKVSEEQKVKIHEIDNRFKAKVAEKELFLKGLVEKAMAAQDIQAIGELQAQLKREIAMIERDCEAAKEKVRAGE
ncbi:MAG: hypothetical protein ACI8UO_004883 [Verrucomicrobiales bacterium]|jgi:hypothetical protein